MTSMRFSSSPVIVAPFTKADGPWSPMPMQEVASTLTSPSSETLPGSIHSLSQRRRINAGAPVHLLDDIVREQHAIPPDGARIKETVKADDALDARARQAERRGDARDGARRQPVEIFLRPDEDLQQTRGIGAVPRQRVVHGLVQIGYRAGLGELRHWRIHPLCG